MISCKNVETESNVAADVREKAALFEWVAEDRSVGGGEGGGDGACGDADTA